MALPIQSVTISRRKTANSHNQTANIRYTPNNLWVAWDSNPEPIG